MAGEASETTGLLRAGRPGRPAGVGRSAGPASRPPASHGRAASRPSAPGAGRPSDVIQEACSMPASRAGRISLGTRRCRSSSGCGSSPASGCWSSTASHLGAQARDVGREISLYRGAMPETTTAALAAQLLGRHTSPSQAAIRAERKIRLAGGAQQPGPGRPRGPGPAPLRAPQQRRGRRGPGPDKSAAASATPGP